MAEVTIDMLPPEEGIAISRGEREETIINFDEIKNHIVYDENGKEYPFSELYSDKINIIIFVRHFLCFVCKEYVEDLALITNEKLQKSNARLIVIGCGPFKFIKQFRKLTGYKGFLFTDPERNIYKRLGMIESMKSGNLSYDLHTKTRPIIGVLKSTWWAIKSVREFQGDVRQQGGSLIVGPGPILHYIHIDNCSADHRSINFLLSKAGVDAVSFPKDPRVQNI